MLGETPFPPNQAIKFLGMNKWAEKRWPDGFMDFFWEALLRKRNALGSCSLFSWPTSYTAQLSGLGPDSCYISPDSHLSSCLLSYQPPGLLFSSPLPGASLRTRGQRWNHQFLLLLLQFPILKNVGDPDPRSSVFPPVSLSSLNRGWHLIEVNPVPHTVSVFGLEEHITSEPMH